MREEPSGLERALGTWEAGEGAGAPSAGPPGGFERRLGELRRAFDQSFAAPPSGGALEMIELGLIVAGGRRYALRIRELTGLHRSRKIVPVPAELPGLLGLSAIRGRLVPVFDLASLLGGAASNPAPKWVALHRAEELLGLAFDEFEGTRRVLARALRAVECAPARAPALPVLPGQHAIHLESGLVHVLDVPAVVSRIGRGQAA